MSRAVGSYFKLIIVILLNTAFLFLYQNCSDVNFNKRSSDELKSLSIASFSIPEQRTKMNQPITFFGQLSIDVEGDVSFNEEFPLSRIRVEGGSFEILDPENLMFKYTPEKNYRGTSTTDVFFTYDENVIIAQIVVIIENPISQFKPVFAVRAIGCLTCHANFGDKVITDMGLGDSYFMGKNFSLRHPIRNTNHTYTHVSGNPYGNHDSSINKAVFQKGIMIPEAQVPANKTQDNRATTLKGYFEKVFALKNSGKPIEVKDKIYIGAPTAETIKDLFSSSSKKIEYFPNRSSMLRNIDPTSQFTQLSDGYYENKNEVFDCSGDLVFDGSVMLRNLRIRTDEGCRIYATKSVFVEGPIDYINERSTTNLQISSAQAIVMGLGKNDCNAKKEDGNALEGNTLHHRLLGIWTSPTHFTRAAPNNPIPMYQDIYAQSLVHKTKEAKCTTSGANIGFSRLLLNAPNIHSRYMGKFNGVVIGEFAIFSLADFQFDYDPVFSKNIPIFPLIDSADYLQIQ